MISKFKQFWINLNTDRVEKAGKLTDQELAQVRKFIKEWEKDGYISSQIVSKLQSRFSKLRERYRAEQAYWTETKRMETSEIKEDGSEIGIKYYQVIPSPSACEVCIKFTQNGRKVFTKQELEKSGHVAPPIHPNCYCVAIPYYGKKR